MLVLIDFVAVKQVRAATLTTPNPVISRTIGIGTNGYTPSEQWGGCPKPASDIYAVGAIGIQCLTGSLPHLLFNEDTLSIEWQHLRRVDRALAVLLNKMIALDYRQRYPSATEALSAIESLIPPPPKPASRRNFIKWWGFGGASTFLVLAWSQMSKELSNEAPKIENTDLTAPVEAPKTNVPAPGFAVASKLTPVQFTSVKLNAQGIIIAKPPGNAQIYTEALGNSVGLNMVKIPGGKFMMGSPESEKHRHQNESPQHQVTV